MEGPISFGTGATLLPIQPGEDVGEKVRSFFQRRENIPTNLKRKTCCGMILSATGCVYSPKLEYLCTPAPTAEKRLLLQLSGSYDIPKDGDVRARGRLLVSFSSDYGITFGRVVGSLIAATPMQVTLLVTDPKEQSIVRPISIT